MARAVAIGATSSQAFEAGSYRSPLLRCRHSTQDDFELFETMML